MNGKEQYMSLLHVYTIILDGCTNKAAVTYLTNRIFKILNKNFSKRKPSDFPKTSYDLQVISLVAYLKEGKLPYAYLFASSIYAINKQNASNDKESATTNTNGLLNKFKALFKGVIK